ncbi:MAG: hypothetical protein ICV85_02940 [Tolypothrix sp. T3-bin4]|nr:hypothetical protein [Tolypothrix sp. T3-bin4]
MPPQTRVWFGLTPPPQADTRLPQVHIFSVHSWVAYLLPPSYMGEPVTGIFSPFSRSWSWQASYRYCSRLL